MNILLIFLSVFSLSFFIAYVYTLKQLKKTTESLAATILLYISSTENKNFLEETASSEDAVHKENFIKFLSDSRDWAFNYIEEVHSELDSFIKDLKYDIAYFEQFGILSEQYPNYEAMQKLAAHYRKIEKLLPEEPNDRR